MSEAHCGPAVLEMLLSFLQVHISQESLARTIHAEDFIADRGLRIDELARIISLARPDMQFWYKDHASVQDLAALIHTFHYPVGVEWQGLFYDSPEEEAEEGEEEGDYGHYSVVVDINVADDIIVIRDPYREFSRHDRFLSLQWFLGRWWDENEMEIHHYTRVVRDEQMMYIITPKGTFFPKSLGMIAA